MAVALCLATLMSGAGLACAAPRHPARQASLEGWAGALLVGGLALIGAGLPLYS